MLFTLPLVFQLSYQAEVCFLSLNDSDKKNGSSVIKRSLFWRVLNWVWTNISFIGLTALCVLQILEFYKSYSIWAGLLNPLKTGSLCLAFWLKFKCSHLREKDFDEFFESQATTCKSHASSSGSISEPLTKRTADNKDDKEF